MNPGRDIFARVCLSALSALSARQRAGYAADVLTGRQMWSGADLRGKARRYGAGYARQRRAARVAWHAAGGAIVALRRTGRLVSAVYLGPDDYGHALYVNQWGDVLHALRDLR